MKLIKRLLGFLLAVMMVAAICPVQAFATTTPSEVSAATAAQRVEKLRNFVKNNSHGYSYFTTTGKNCTSADSNHPSSNWCSYCVTTNLLNASWIKSDLGLLPSSNDQLPYLRWASPTEAASYGKIGVIEAPAYSCVGFAMIAHWFIYAQKSTDNIAGEHIATIDLNNSTSAKTNLEKYARVGDVLVYRTAKTNGTYSHAAIYTGCSTSGITVLDSNWGGSSGPTCKMQEHTIPYSSYRYVEITRATNASKTVTYTITYNANGGTNAPAAQTKTKDVALTLSSTEPTRTGYNFLGWATTSTASSAQYSAGSSYTANANVTLYAVWEVKTYAVRYDANGGTGAPATQNKVHDKNLALSSVIPHYEGHVFKEWRDLTPIAGTWTETKPTSGVYETRYLYYCYGYEYNNDMTFWYGADKSKVEVLVKKNLPSGISYDAKKLRYITYISSANAGSSFKPASGGTFTANYTNQDGSTGTAQIKNTEMYYKAPVYKQDSVSSVAYQPGGTYTANHDVTLVAVWEEAPTATYTISYNGNGGSALGTQTKTQGSSIRLSTQVPTRTGYTFKGWATSSTAAVAQYQPGDTYTADADLTLYAVWKINSYAITYYDGSNVLSGSSKNYGESVRIIAGPTKEGYTFKGWSTSPTATTAQYQPGDSCTLYADLNLYAVWEKNAPVTYTVSFNANGGTGSMSAVGKVSGSYTLPACSFTAPTGKQFKGWATSPNGAVITGTYNVTANITFYAIWEAIPAADGTTIQIGKAVSVREKEVVIPVSLSNNTGVASMNFKINYDKTRLQLTGFEDAQMTGWMVGVGSGEKAIWVDENGSNVNGEILSLKFMVLDTAEDGLAEITVTEMDVVNVDEEDVSVMVVSGGIEVISRIPGDTNDDGKISAADVLRLKKYLAGMEVEINLLNADVTGDGKVSAADLLRLKKYFAGMDAVLE